MPRKSRKSQAAKKKWKLHLEASGKPDLVITDHEAPDCEEETPPVTIRHLSTDSGEKEISVRASFSQSDSRFSDYSRGSQCVANSLMFLAHLNEVDRINSASLDRILITGDKLYCQIKSALEKQNLFVSMHLNFDELPTEMETDRGSYVLQKSERMSGLLLQDAPHDFVGFLNLTLRLEDLGIVYTQALLIVGGLCISVFQDRHGQYGFFDPHSRNEDGSCFEENGRAVMVTFHTVFNLTNRLIQLFHCSLKLAKEQQYDILPVSFQRLISEDQELSRIASDTNVVQPVCFQRVISEDLELNTMVGDTNVAQVTSSSSVSAKLSRHVRQKMARRINQEQEQDKYTRTSPSKRYSSDLDFQMRKKAYIRNRYSSDTEFRQRHKEYVRYKYRHDPELSIKQKERKRNRYSNDLVFCNEKKKQFRHRYTNDPEFSEKKQQQFRHLYRSDQVFCLKQKNRIRHRYRNDQEFCLKQKNRIRHLYRSNSEFCLKQKNLIRHRYRNDSKFCLKQKNQIRLRYRSDSAFRLRQKEYVSRQNSLDAPFYFKRKAYMAAHFKKRHSEFLAFRSVQQISKAYYFKLRRTLDLKTLHSMRCSSHIKDQYRNISIIAKIRSCPDNSLMILAKSRFQSSVKLGPTYICAVCHRCLFQNQVRKCEPSSYSRDPELASTCLTNTYLHVCVATCTGQGRCMMPERSQQWICYSCHENLKSGRLPMIAVANKLVLDPIPPELQGLNILERHVIAKFIPFAKIVSLPKGQQRAIHGAVVCVPSEVESTVQHLPRPPSDSHILRVKLKRRLRYKGYFQFQTLDMAKVTSALQKLKQVHSEYRGMVLRSDVEESYLETTERVSGKNDEEPNGEAHPVNATEDTAEEQDVGVATNYGIVFDSCLQPADVGQEILSFGDNVYSVAPAEGNHPAAFFKTPRLEAMAFPVQFSTGRNTIDEPDRPRKISPSRYFNARLFGADNRFAMDTNYIFFAQFVTEMHLAMSSMSIQLRKGRVFTKDGRKITTRLLKDQKEVQKLVRHGEVTRFMQPLRGTPAFWEKTMRDLFACLRQLGLPTFFCTFSAAEMRWPEVIEAIKRQQGESVEFSELDWAAKCEILRSNPVTVIRMFEKRVEALMRDLILSPAQPIGEVVDWFYRVEFQARGSGHIHCLFWIKDAPKFDGDPDDQVVAFVNRYISCQLPDDTEDPELHSVVKEVQSHSRSHTKSCKKGKKHCRFGFPKPPVKSTFISRPQQPNPDDPNLEKVSKGKLKSVWDLLHDPTTSCVSTDEILAKCNMTYQEFSQSLKHVAGKSELMMRRDPKDCWINAYNPDLLRAWDANMDIQFVLDPYSCVMYILSYITKAEHQMSEYLKCIVRDSNQENASDMEQMKQVMQAYSKSREVSVQEAVTRVCSLKLKSCSRDVVFIPTDDNAMKMSLPMQKLKMRPPDSDQVWMTGLPEKYKARPVTPEFESLCMADFASNYRLVYGRQRGGKNVVPLQDNLGFVQKRTRGRPAVIRYARFSENKEPEKFFCTLLKVYLPYRMDSQLKMAPFNSYQSFFLCASVKLPGSEVLMPVCRIVTENRKRYETDSEAVEQAIKDFVNVGPAEDAWANFAPTSELIRIEDISERQPLDPAETDEQDDVPEYRPKVDDTTSVPFVECPVLSSEVIRGMYRSLNQTQASVFYQIRDWCLKVVNSEQPDQFFYFVTGGAGTGKSHLIKCIYHEATKLFRRLPSMDELDGMSRPTVILSSFTGTASFNISGNTLHSILKLPKSLKPPYQGLGNSLDEMRIILSQVQIMVIDEISMVSKELFSYVDLRLQQIKGSKKPFGGVSVLAVGDFFQLPPVGKLKALCVYEDNMLDLWRDRFQKITLTKIMRQKEDAAFAEMLNRLRVKRKAEPLLDGDRALLTSRILRSSEDCPSDVLHIYATNKQVDKHNDSALLAHSSTVIRIDAQDHIKDDRTGRMVRQSAPFRGQKGDLPDSLLLSEGARVVLTRNLDTADGLVNGTFGRISRIVSSTGRDGVPHVEKIGLNLDDPNAGAKSRTGGDRTVYIKRLEERCRQKGLVRCQFPLKLAFACTSHKVQGMTSSSAVVSLQRVFEAGMAYVALSRTTSLQGLHIIDFNEKMIYCNEEILASMEHMPEADLATIMPLLAQVEKAAEGRLILVHHNVEGLRCHIDDVRYHHEILLGHVLCFTETHTFGSTVSEDLQIEGFVMHRRNRQTSYSNFPLLANQKGGGVAIYVRESVNARLLPYITGVTDLEFLTLKVSHPVKAVVVAIYRPPSYKTTDFLRNLKYLLDAIEIMDQDHVVICGDFNEDPRSSIPKPINNYLAKRGYAQVIEGVTTEKRTTLDLIFTSRTDNCVSSGVLHSYYSYHSPIYAILKE